MTNDEPTIFNVVTLPALFGACYVQACRVCGALVPIDPPDYADRHARWHEEAPR